MDLLISLQEIELELEMIELLELLGLCWNILDDALGDAGGHQRGVVLPLLPPRPVLTVDSRYGQ